LRAIGVRIAPSQIRFAVVRRDDQSFILENAESENKLVWPADLVHLQERVQWAFDESCRIFRHCGELACVAIKVPEYTQKRTKGTRAVDCIEGAVLLAASSRGVEVADYIYSQLGTKRGTVCQHAEQRVGRTPVGWDEQIADAVVAAWKALR
jgi:hypothetical protein